MSLYPPYGGPAVIGELKAFSWDWTSAPSGKVGYGVKVYLKKPGESSYTLINWAGQAGSMSITPVVGSNQLKFEGCYIDPYYNYQEFCGQGITYSSFWGYEPPALEKFAWEPSHIEVGNSAKFVWDIKNSSMCINNTPGPNYGPSDASGEFNSGVQNTPITIITQWYCYDEGGERYPASGYLQSTLQVLPVGGVPRKTVFVHTDNLGTPVAETNENGGVQ